MIKHIFPKGTTESWFKRIPLTSNILYMSVLWPPLHPSVLDFVDYEIFILIRNDPQLFEKVVSVWYHSSCPLHLDQYSVVPTAVVPTAYPKGPHCSRAQHPYCSDPRSPLQCTRIPTASPKGPSCSAQEYLLHCPLVPTAVTHGPHCSASGSLLQYPRVKGPHCKSQGSLPSCSDPGWMQCHNILNL